MPVILSIGGMALPASRLGTVPAIISHPANLVVTEGATAQFSVTATSPTPITYQWQRSTGGAGFVNIAGATSSTYTTAATVLGDSGDDFRCVATNVTGSTNSNQADLGVVAASGYDTAARIAGLRAHSGFGSLLTVNDTRFPGSSSGLELPAAPVGPFTTRSVSTMADLNTYANLARQDITLLPGSYTGGTLTISTGTHNRINLGGQSIYGLAVNGGSACHHLRIENGTFTNLLYVWSYNEPFFQDATYATDIHLKDITLLTSDGPTSANWAVRRLLVERCSFDHLTGGNPFFVWGGSSNVLVMNSQLLATATPTSVENPCRANGCHLFFTIDCRIGMRYINGATAHKFSWRSHRTGLNGTTYAGGTNGMVNCQLELGGVMTNAAGDEGAGSQAQNTQLVFVDTKLYEPDGVPAAGSGFSIPNTAPDNTNINAYATGIRYYTNNSPQFNIAPPGVRTDNQTGLAYTGTPAWPYYNITPVTT